MLNKTVALQPFADISEHRDGFEIRSVQFGWDSCVYVLLINRNPTGERGALIPPVSTKTYTYKILIIKDNELEVVVIEGQNFNYHFVQPLRNQLLLVGTTSSYYGKENYDLNAKVFDVQGRTVREFLIGDGIQNVQVTEEGTIWTSYFDEGVFGSNGWDKRIGEHGLVAWDEYGHKRYEDQISYIADCYALNAVNEKEVWFYYYTDFLLGCVSDGADQAKVSFINPHISGSSGFCTDGKHFLFDGGYRKTRTYFLKEQEKPANLSKGYIIQFLNHQGVPLIPFAQDYRKNRLLLCEGHLLYQITVEELL